MRRNSLFVATLVTALILAACTGEAQDSTTTSAEGTGTTTSVATTTTDSPPGETKFTLVLGTDPGSLDPQLSPTATAGIVSSFGYDSLVNVDPDDGSIQTGLAADWSVDGIEVVLTLREGVTCSDGSPLTASDVAANLDFVGDPENGSPMFGVAFTPGSTFAADDAAGTVTMTLPGPSPFVLNSLAILPIVCANGMADRATLVGATAGTGPYVLSEARAGSSYVYAKRDGYTWGPDGASTDVAGMPDIVELRVIENEATATNLLLAGDVNAATILGPDAQRLESLFSAPGTLLLGEMWFHQIEGRHGLDPAVRSALTQGINLEQLQGVMTAEAGSTPTGFAVLQPAACPGDSVVPALPSFDVAAAGATLDAAGWTVSANGMRSRNGDPLSMTFLHDTSLGPAAGAAAELAVQQWTALGVTVEVMASAGDATIETLFGTGDWDIAWIPINVSNPDQLMPYLSGPHVLEGGANFGNIQNEEYATRTAAAMELPGTEGCPEWLAAETALVSRSDVVPFAMSVVRTFGNGAEFAASAGVIPTSIRVTN